MSLVAISAPGLVKYFVSSNVQKYQADRKTDLIKGCKDGVHGSSTSQVGHLSLDCSVCKVKVTRKGLS